MCYTFRALQDERLRERFYALRADGKYYSRPAHQRRSYWDESPLDFLLEPEEPEPKEEEEYIINLVLEARLAPRLQQIEPLFTSAYKQLVKMSPRTFKRKVIILGAPSVGKTSLAKQYITPPTYIEQYFPTIEQTERKQIPYEGTNYDCEIIDTAGQDEYTLFPSKYANGVHGYLLVYSINSRQSFDMIQTIHDKILDFSGATSMPMVVVGQKADLNGERRITLAEGQALAKKLGAGFVESSAKDNINVGKAFEVLCDEMQKRWNPAPEKKKTGWFSGWGS